MKTEDILNNIDYMTMARKASVSFLERLSESEIKNCIYNAAWNCEKCFKEEKGVKRSTYFYRGVIFECLKRIKFNFSKSGVEKSVEPTYESNSFSHVDALDEIQNCPDTDILYDKFFLSKTLVEIAKERNTSKQAIQQRIDKNLDIMRRRLSV